MGASCQQQLNLSSWNFFVKSAMQRRTRESVLESKENSFTPKTSAFSHSYKKGRETAVCAAVAFYRTNKGIHAPNLLGNALSQARVQHYKRPSFAKSKIPKNAV
jgi:hypothetical protein